MCYYKLLKILWW